MSRSRPRFKMTVEDVQELVRLQMGDDQALVNDHKITLRSTLVPPQGISIIVRTVRNERNIDQMQDVWLVGQEKPGDGYRIVLREDGMFGLASKGFASDSHLVLVGWYGGLKAAFLGM